VRRTVYPLRPARNRKERDLNMKLLTCVVPCYNSAAYMDRCISSIVEGSGAADDVEVIIVDDGSNKDYTFEHALAWQERYPNVVRAIHQENKGHGGAINTAVSLATGEYFKVLDSDDWVDKDAYDKLIGFQNINTKNQ
jgi:glycosyltransferase involved in cell wall biosynthesis